jgi:hypothetical protein
MARRSFILLAQGAIQRAQRLIQHQQARVGGQAARQCNALLLAPRNSDRRFS